MWRDLSHSSDLILDQFTQSNHNVSLGYTTWQHLSLSKALAAACLRLGLLFGLKARFFTARIASSTELMKPLASSSLCFCKSDSSSKLRLLLCFYPILTDFDWEESFRAMSPAKGTILNHYLSKMILNPLTRLQFDGNSIYWLRLKFSNQWLWWWCVFEITMDLQERIL
ncbi:unnamed protein product [Arabidopsis lyrata]|nr:unnamed protein product [Arabidopsis lyrata]